VGAWTDPPADDSPWSDVVRLAGEIGLPLLLALGVFLFFVIRDRWQTRRERWL
jgi:hypothetical protein